MDQLVNWAHLNSTFFNTAKSKVRHLGIKTVAHNDGLSILCFGGQHPGEQELRNRCKVRGG